MSDPTTDEDEINRLHREKMERRQAARRRVLATRTEERGLLIVHTGAGKGKSTAAFGMVLRCLGHGMRVGIVQFVKGSWTSGERTVLAGFPDLVTCRAMGEGFTWDTQDRARDIAAASIAWEMAQAMLADQSYRLVLLDELNIVLRYGYLPVDDIIAALKAKPRDLHVVVTGRNAPSALIEPRQAPVPRRGQGAEGDRVLMTRTLTLPRLWRGPLPLPQCGRGALGWRLSKIPPLPPIAGGEGWGEGGTVHAIRSASP